MQGDPERLRTLRVSYHDWCSARLAEHFLRLTPEEVFALMEAAEAAEPTGEQNTAAGALTPAAVVASGSLRATIGRVTEILFERLGLPDFETWRSVYESNPARYEAELLGFRGR